MKRLIIVGGVAGGASAATRARRLDEDLEIIVLERGPYVSFANCGLPYHLGRVIQNRDNLILQTPASLKARFNIDVRLNTEALSINRDRKTILVRSLETGREEELAYDKLILSPGGDAVKPPIPGIDLANVFTFKTIPDMDAVIAYLDRHQSRHATVVGGGFIGLEVAENLRLRGLAVTLVEMATQVMPPLDREMASLLHQHLRFHGLDLRLGTKVTRLASSGARTAVEFESGTPVETDCIIFAAGVRALTGLAQSAGLALGERRGIRVDDRMQTADPDILAVGDVVETSHLLTGDPVMAWLAGPANRQGRLAADVAAGLEGSRYRGTLGTWICKVFDLTCAQTGLSEKVLQRGKAPFAKIYTHPANHAGYYPDAFPMSLKVLYDPTTGKLLGAQIVGTHGVDKRIDVLATALTAGMTVRDLSHLELAYAPPYGSAKDPVNMIGMIAENILDGLHPAITPDELSALGSTDHVLLDVRDQDEFDAGHIPGSVLIPVDQLRSRIDELPRDKELIVLCQVGLRGYVAVRMLLQRGFKARNLLGGYKTWTMFHEDELKREPEPKPIKESFCSTPKMLPLDGEVVELDACGLQCPGPLMRMKEKMDTLKPGQYLRILATDPGFPADAEAWSKGMGHRVVEKAPQNGKYMVILEKGEPTTPATTAGAAVPEGTKALTMVVFSNDLDRGMAAFIIANGAAAMGMKVTLFFTFWGLNILRRKQAPPMDKNFLENMFGMMMPKGPDALGLSKMHFGGMGTAMMKHVMKEKHVTPLPDLIKSAQDAGVKLVACTMTMDIMGIKKEELIDGVEEGGVASYLGSASSSAVNLFV